MMLNEKFMMIFPRSLVWDGILQPTKTLISLDHISKAIARQDLKFRHTFHKDVFANGFLFKILKLRRHKVIENILEHLFEAVKP